MPTPSSDRWAGFKDFNPPTTEPTPAAAAPSTGRFAGFADYEPPKDEFPRGERLFPVVQAENIVNRIIRPALGRFVEGFGSGVRGIGEADFLETWGLPQTQNDIWGTPADQPVARPVPGARGAGLRAAGEKIVAKGERLRGTAEGLAPGLAGGVGGVIGMMPVLPGAVFDELFQSAKAGGASDDEAAKAAMPTTVVNTALELISLGKGIRAAKIIGKLPAGGFRDAVGAAYKVLQAGATEGITEPFQQIVSNLVRENYDLDRDAFSAEGWSDGLAEAAKLGLGVGMILPIGIGGANIAFQQMKQGYQGRLGSDVKAQIDEATSNAPAPIPSPTIEATPAPEPTPEAPAEATQEAAQPAPEPAAVEVAPEAAPTPEGPQDAVTPQAEPIPEVVPEGTPGSPTDLGPIDNTEPEVAEEAAAPEAAPIPEEAAAEPEVVEAAPDPVAIAEAALAKASGDVEALGKAPPNPGRERDAFKTPEGKTRSRAATPIDVAQAYDAKAKAYREYEKAFRKARDAEVKAELALKAAKEAVNLGANPGVVEYVAKRRAEIAIKREAVTQAEDRRGRQYQTLHARVREEGGIRLSSVKKGYDWKTDFVDSGLHKSKVFIDDNTLSDLDEMAERLANTGDIPTGTTGDQLLEMLKERRLSRRGETDKAAHEEKIGNTLEGLRYEDEELQKLEALARENPDAPLERLKQMLGEVDEVAVKVRRRKREVIEAKHEQWPDDVPFVMAPQLSDPMRILAANKALVPDRITGMGPGEASLLHGWTPVETAFTRRFTGRSSQVARSVASTPSKLAGAIFDAYTETLTDRVIHSGTAVGQNVGFLARLVSDAHRSIVGHWQEQIADFQKLVNGTTLRKQRAAWELTTLVPGPDASSANYKFKLAVEDDAEMAKLSPYGRGVVDNFREIISTINDTVEKMNVQFRMKDGTVVPFENLTNKRLPRVYSEFVYAALRSPGKNQAFIRVFAKAIASYPQNGMTEDDVYRELSGARPEVSERQIGIEHARKFKFVPDVIYTDRGMVPVLAADPFMAAEQLKHRIAGRLAFMQVFGQGMQAELEKLPDLYEHQGGNRADMVNLMRALQHQPVEDPYPVPHTAPGEIGYDAARLYGMAAQMWKGGRLTLSAIPNAVETLSKVRTLTGNRRFARAMTEFVTGFEGASGFDIAIAGARAGAHTIDVVNFNFDRNFAIESVGRLAMQVLNAPGIRVNEWNEIIAYHNALLAVRDWKRGRVHWKDDTMLRFLKFEPSQREALLTGNAEPSLYRTYLQRFVERTQGTTSLPAEKSRLAHSRTFNALFPFQAYSQLTLRTLKQTGEVTSQAFRDGDMEAGMKAAVVGVEMMLGHALSGAMALLLRAMVTGGFIGAYREWEHFQEDWWDALVETTKYALGGVLVDAWDKVRTLKDPIGAAFDMISNTQPGSMIRELLDFTGDQNQYAGYVGMEKAEQFLLRSLPAARAAQSLAAVYGLGVKDADLDFAIKAQNRWFKKNRGFPSIRDIPAEDNDAYMEETQTFRNAMKRAARLIRENAPEGKVVEALLVAAKGAGKTPDQIAASLNSRQLLIKVPKDLREKFYTEMRVEDVRKLKQYDELLKSWAKSVKGRQ